MRLTLRRNRRFVLFVSVSLAFVLLLVVFQKTTPVIRVMNRVRAVASSGGTAVGNLFEHIFYSKATLLADNTHLQTQVTAYAEGAGKAAALMEENAALKALFDYRERSVIKPIIARVISRTAEINGQVALIDRGELDGVAIGDAVIVGDGLFVGTVVQVRSATSIVRLLTDRESKVGVEVLGAARTIGIAEGQDGVLLRIDFIPQSIEVNLNDLIVTSGLDPEVPAGLVVGAVQEVQKDEHDPFQQAFIEPLVDVRTIHTVGILSLIHL